MTAFANLASTLTDSDFFDFRKCHTFLSAVNSMIA